MMKYYKPSIEEETRATGRSTRLVDKYIQDLFNNGEVVIIDHHNIQKVNNYLTSKVINRLKLEHIGLLFEVNKNKIKLV